MRYQLQQRRQRVSLSGLAVVLRERLGGAPRKLGPMAGGALKKEKHRETELTRAELGAPLGAPTGEISKSSEAIQKQLMSIYKNPTPEEMKKARRQKTKDPVVLKNPKPSLACKMNGTFTICLDAKC